MENREVKIMIKGDKYKEYVYPYDFKKLEKDFNSLARGKNMDKCINLILGKTKDDIKCMLEIKGHYIILYKEIFENKCYYPLNIKELSECINKITLRYEKLGYDYIFR